MEEDKLNKFSVPLGLLDYVNPVLYSVTMVMININLYPVMTKPYNVLLLIGAIISVFFGLIIPTGKVMVGLGIIKFKMPVSLVLCVNSGIFLTGLMLIHYALNINLWVFLAIILVSILLLLIIYLKTKKFNTIAVLTGAFGYLMIYVSLIVLSVYKSLIFPVVLYGLAILLFIMLCGVGIKADLKNPKVHWLIEISNVTCQAFVTLGTILLFL